MRATKIEYQKIVSESKRLITELQKYKNIEDEKYKMDRMNRMKTKEIRRRDQFKKSRERKKNEKMFIVVVVMNTTKLKNLFNVKHWLGKLQDRLSNETGTQKIHIDSFIDILKHCK